MRYVQCNSGVNVYTSQRMEFNGYMHVNNLIEVNDNLQHNYKQQSRFSRLT